MSADNLLASLGIDASIAGEPFSRDAAGHLVDPAGARVVLVAGETNRGFRQVLEAEHPGAWNEAMKACGVSCGNKIAAGLDAVLVRQGKPALSALPLEACLGLLEHSFSAYGWGRLKIDLGAAADHGFVVASLADSYSVEVLADAGEFVDTMAAGVLQGFFTHISGQSLGCEEIACARSGATECTFVITAPERLATITEQIGKEPAETLLARLRQ
jgi:predicted hydrocarbon binding protein